MTHNVVMDGLWLRQLHTTSMQNVGLLGPLHRRERVLAVAEIDNKSWIDRVLKGPAGLSLGGELPESIALSILAQCHASLYQCQGESLNQTETIHR